MLGYPDGDNLLLLQRNWLPLDALLSADHDSPYYNERNRASVFYAQSWALVHYLLTDAARTRQMLDLLTRLSGGLEPHEAVPAALGMNLQKLDDEVRRYVFKQMYGIYRVKLAESIEIERQEVAVMPPAAVAARRGSLFEALGRREAAEAEWTRAFALDANHPEAHIGLGLVADAAGKAEEAREHFARAAASAK